MTTASFPPNRSGYALKQTKRPYLTVPAFQAASNSPGALRWYGLDSAREARPRYPNRGSSTL
ncbi:hypothetical protein N7509_005664 [Penicillium cosmopolitanum]|uniref:Uncharacterized protein n=1 Tax=Penicillium cosmopolitanum TaxID=1131564 RepID=A0A9W9W2V4_9EURO|nr:uncharacterized protein N7509_005664 [Penicillium cosmopolitanum]KAJ5397551.1 hypothetical protein N7509_005664 [Penicillium cosmopolitanum]